MIILQAAIAFGLFLCLIGCVLLFIVYPILIYLFIFWLIKLGKKNKQKLDKKDYFIIAINGLMYASISIVTLALIIYFLLVSFVDLSIS